MTSPQFLAMEWLYEHPDLSAMSLGRQKQLYVLATFFYAMEGPHWRCLIAQTFCAVVAALAPSETRCMIDVSYTTYYVFNITYKKQQCHLLSLRLLHTVATGARIVRPQAIPTLVLPATIGRAKFIIVT